jgi:hypothetical protein
MVRINRLFRHAPLAAAVAALVGLTSFAAHAQMDANGIPQSQLPKTQLRPRQPVEAPSALPGATSSPSAAAPERSSTELAPNAALFDAIDRGDIAAARDALGRGAELHAQNVLGQTPIDMSVDLGRNDITFLLLSMRDAAPPAGAAANAATKPPAKAAHAATLLAKAKPVPARPAATPAPRPREYVSTDPGTPVPQMGFLGFGRPGQ